MRGKSVARDYYTNSKGRLTYKTYSADSPEGNKYFQIANRRTEIKKEIAHLENILGRDISNKLLHCRISLRKSILNESLWKGAGNDMNPRPKKGDYYHNGIQMRSRTEVLVAEILDEIGLDYKYEPAIQFGEEVFYPDFLVYIPWLKKCLIIEFFGKSDDEGYLHNNVHKIAVYSNSGLILNRDVIGLYGTKEAMVSSEIIYNNVVLILNLLATEALVLV